MFVRNFAYLFQADLAGGSFEKKGDVRRILPKGGGLRGFYSFKQLGEYERFYLFIFFTVNPMAKETASKFYGGDRQCYFHFHHRDANRVDSQLRHLSVSQ